MVFCCVPKCGTDSGKCDPSVTFHDFPSNPDVAAKWTKQINCALKSTPVWVPQVDAVICSKHFLQTDFKDNTDALKPHCVPTVFGHKFIGENAESQEPMTANECTQSPLIVKVFSPQLEKIINNKNANKNYVAPYQGKKSTQISAVPSQAKNVNQISNVSLLKNINRISSVPFRPSNVNVISAAPSKTVPQVSAVSSLVKNVNLNTAVTTQAKYVRSVSAVVPETKKLQPLSTVTSQEKNVQSISVVPSQIASDYTPKNSFSVQTVFSRTFQNMQANHSASTNKAVSKDVGPGQSVATKVADSDVNQPKKRNFCDDTVKTSRKREKINNDLIEISPNTFLKINPDIIKVNKKLTPSGNTVLQFLMDPKVAASQSIDFLPKIVHEPESNKNLNNLVNGTNSSDNEKNIPSQSTENAETETAVQHIVGHLVDTHVCADTCSALNDSDLMDESNGDLNSINDLTGKAISQDEADTSCKKNGETSKADSSFLEKAPVLLTTKMPISHCFNDKPKFLLQLKQKNRQIAALKLKISNLQKKVEELEDRCIVQERQLSYSFIKRLKTIRKNSTKGDPSATYILEQIRSYTDNSKMRWSDSTLAQCAIWCRKAPYAYEYFKKADFFKLPCLGTVKRFMKKHPDVNALKKIVPNPQVEDESSSDFDFDDEDPDKGQSENEIEAHSPKASCPDGSKDAENVTKGSDKDSIVSPDTEDTTSQPTLQISHVETSKNEESSSTHFPINNSNVEIQEIMLPSGEIVQCYSSSISNTADGQYFIIPNIGEHNAGDDQEYSVVQADSLPVILQTVDSSQPQEQLIFITNSATPVQSTETTVSS